MKNPRKSHAQKAIEKLQRAFDNAESAAEERQIEKQIERLQRTEFPARVKRQSPKKKASRKSPRKNKTNPRKKKSKIKKAKIDPHFAGKFNLCKADGRLKFYRKILADKTELKKEMDTEDFDDTRVIMEIGYDIKGRTKRGKGRAKKEVGYRIFKSLRKLERFLALKKSWSYWTKEETTPPDWSKRGLCHYNKRARIVQVKYRGERIIGEEILKRYELVS